MKDIQQQGARSGVKDVMKSKVSSRDVLRYLLRRSIRNRRNGS